jgi:hypothetical protein
MNFDVAKLNDRDGRGSNLNGYVDLGPDMCGVGTVDMNNDCSGQDYPMDSLNLTGEQRNPMDHA